jgi:hypothetical protein
MIKNLSMATVMYVVSCVSVGELDFCWSALCMKANERLMQKMDKSNWNGEKFYSKKSKDLQIVKSKSIAIFSYSWQCRDATDANLYVFGSLTLVNLL